MLLVKTEVKQSKIEGVGLYSKARIEKGTIVWVENEKTTKKFKTKEELLKQYPNSEEFLYLKDSEWNINLDNSKYMNHSANANTKYNHEFKNCVAIRDIDIGEEITSNYEEFDDEHEFYKSNYI